jgi:RNA 3'-terminal phosphate cyclase (ATP)
MIEIDGSQGEGGGQILRTALSLSICTGQPFRMHSIRARRSRPGLMRQHLTAVNAAARISHAEVDGADIGSKVLVFHPHGVAPGDYDFAVGTAGSTTLVAQTVMPALLVGERTCNLRLEGGTHNPHAPPFEFLQKAFVPLLVRMGVQIDASLERYGFFPAGGGEIRLRIAPCRKLAALHLDRRGPLRHSYADAVVANLPADIARRELAVVKAHLGLRDNDLRILDSSNAHGHGNVVLIVQEYEHVTEVFTGFGERGVRAEVVAERAAKEAGAFGRGEAAVGAHLADQLLLPMALAGAGSFTTLEPSSHARTNMDVIARFLPVRFHVEARNAASWRIEVEAARSHA